MLNSFRTLQSIKTSTAINIFIYYLQKLPFIKRLVTDELYANLSAKQALTIVVSIIRIIWNVLLRLLYIGLIVYLPAVWLGEGLPKDVLWQYFVHIFFVISFIVSGTSSAVMLEPKREKYVAIKLFRIHPNSYMRSSLTLRYIAFFVYLLPVLLLFGLLLKGSFIQILLLCLSVTLWRIAVEYLHLKLYEKTNIILIKQQAIVWLVIGLGYIAAFLPLYLHHVPATSKLLLHPVAFILIGFMGIAAAFQLHRYRDYRAITDAATRRDDPLLNLGRMITEAQQTSVKTKESDYAKQPAHSEQLERKEGFDYLNALFFARHHSIVTSPYYKRLAIIAIAGVIIIAGLLLFQQQLADINIETRIILPFLFMVMYFLTIGEKLCKAMFYHCDISLLRYGFYRHAAYRHFRIRFYKILVQNTVISVLLGLVLTIALMLAGTNLWNADIAYLWLSVLALALFFSVHHLFLYYIFQPYTTELNIKNPFYYFITSFVSALSAIAIVMRPEPLGFAIFIALLAIAYTIIAHFLVRKRGHHTFTLK
ncbi:hypothetical protein V1L65_01700 [Paenibacillus sp. IITD108]